MNNVVEWRQYMVNGAAGEDVQEAAVEEIAQEIVHAHVIRFAQIQTPAIWL
jgi:hypothetical protein